MARSNSAKDTSFTLRWFEDSAPRRTVTAELNKGEARNSLARAVAFHRFGRFRGRGLENQKTRAAPLNLVTAAIILFNCGYLGRAIHELRRQGMPIDPATQAQLSPLGWGRINLTGDYAWSDRLELGADGLMPLLTKPYRERRNTIKYLRLRRRRQNLGCRSLFPDACTKVLAYSVRPRHLTALRAKAEVGQLGSYGRHAHRAEQP